MEGGGTGASMGLRPPSPVLKMKESEVRPSASSKSVPTS